MKRILLAAATIALVSYTPAYAHWQNTRWGMTPEEAKQAYPGTTYTTGDFIFDVRMGFDEGGGRGLSGVYLDLSEMTKCVMLRGSLSGKYGNPPDEFRKQSSFMSIFRWEDKPHNNKITLITRRDGCTIMYEPLLTASSKGL
jgi:hypothetical protein